MSKNGRSIIHCSDLGTLWKKGCSIHYVKATMSAGPFLDKLERMVPLPIRMGLSLFCEMSFTFPDRTLQQPLGQRGSQNCWRGYRGIGEKGKQGAFL